MENTGNSMNPDEEPTRFHVSDWEETSQPERLPDESTRIRDAEPRPVGKAYSEIPDGDRSGSGTTSYYVFDTRLGEGGFGVVYLATDRHTGQRVAIKQLYSHFARNKEVLGRFYSVAKLTKDLEHPNIVRVLGAFDQDGVHQLVMEYVAGESLRSLLNAQGRLPVVQAVDIAVQVCDALTYAHGKGIIHRDIKPENILIAQNGCAKITDFDIAKLLVSSEWVTRTTTRLGTAYYMAPEQRKSPKDVDSRADLFSVGVMLYEMLTGEIPMGMAEPPSTYNAEVTPGLDEIVQLSLALRPEQRWSSARAMADALRKERARAPWGREWIGYGRHKTAHAIAHLAAGPPLHRVDGKLLDEYVALVPDDVRSFILRLWALPDAEECLARLSLNVTTNGSNLQHKRQGRAVAHAIAGALGAYEPDLQPLLKQAGYSGSRQSATKS